MKLEYEYSLGLRWGHWIRFCVMWVLIGTGFYIAYVFASPKPSSEPILFLQADIRFWHLVAGFVLIGVTLFKTYLFFFDRGVSRKEREAFKYAINPKLVYQQIKYYLFMGKEPEYKGTYNPLQFWGYFFLYVMLYVICITGLILFIHCYHENLGAWLAQYLLPLEKALGGLAHVRIIHHIAMWGIIVFILGHIYLAILATIRYKNGGLDGMMSGYKYLDENKVQH